MKLKRKITTAALTVALIAGGSVAMAPAAQAAGGSWSGQFAQKDACTVSVAAQRAVRAVAGATNIKGSCSPVYGSNGSSYWLGVVTWNS